MVRTRGGSSVSGRRSFHPRNSGESVDMERTRDMVRTRGGSTVSGRRSFHPRNSGESVDMERTRGEATVYHNSGENVDRTAPNTTEVKSLSRKKRGPTLGIMKPKPGQEKMLVNIIRQKFLEPEARTKTRILFQKCFKEARTNFEQWPKDEIELLWGEYLKFFRFASSDEERRGQII